MSGTAGARERPPGTGGTRPPEYVCGWCGRAFREDRGQPACRSCPLTRLCGRVRCPRCGWENPARPGWHRRVEAGPDRTEAASGDAAGPLRRLLRRLLPGPGGMR